MELDSVAKVRYAFLRLVDTEADDPDLEVHGETATDVIYVNLTRGFRQAQRWMISQGYDGWRKRSSAITSWSGSDATTGGKYNAVPTDFLKAYGDKSRSAFVKVNGDRWGYEVEPDEDIQKGNYYYYRGGSSGQEIWLARGASVPSPIYLEYHYTHPAWTSSVTIDFPMDARALGVAYAANSAMQDAWLPGGQELEVKISRSLNFAQEEARRLARPSKSPRQIKKPTRYGSSW